MTRASGPGVTSYAELNEKNARCRQHAEAKRLNTARNLED